MELIVWFVVELLGEILFEVLLELGLSGIMGDGSRRRHPVAVVPGYLVLGALLGGLWVWMFPARILAPGPVPGLSLFVGPLAAGFVMEWWGRLRRGRGHATTGLATWYGGGALALGVAAARLMGTC